MTIRRRGFLKVVGASGALAGAATSTARAATPAVAGDGGVEFNGMLIDTTMCIGCRACEAACNEANQLPAPKVSFDSDAVFAERRDTTPDAFTVLHRFPNEKKPDEPTEAVERVAYSNQRITKTNRWSNRPACSLQVVSRPPVLKKYFVCLLFVGLDTADEHRLLDQRNLYENGTDTHPRCKRKDW